MNHFSAQRQNKLNISHKSDVLEIVSILHIYLFNYIATHSKYLHIGLLTAITIEYHNNNNQTAIGVAVNYKNTAAYIL